MAVTNSKWVQVKSPSDIALNGVTVELDWTNNNIVGLKVIDEAGNVLRVTKGDYSEMRVLVPQTVEKYRLQGTVFDSPFQQDFDDEYAAENRKNEFGELGDKAVLAINKVKVPA